MSATANSGGVSASQWILRAYTGAFLVFMFMPLILLIIASFNDVSPPSVTDWQGLTGKWYAFFWMDEADLRADDVLRSLDRPRLAGCFGNSMIVAAFVVPLSLILGLAGAILLTRWQTRWNSFLWWVLLSPMLAPGIVLGLSTLILWNELGVSAGQVTIILAQTTFIAGYPMLVIMARLQRQPPEHEEAALDLGASPWRVFRRITLPYLIPALASAGVIAFMTSFENYNTTMFAKGGSCTFSTEIGAMVRNPNGHPPVINALGAIIVALTVISAVVYTFYIRRESAKK